MMATTTTTAGKDEDAVDGCYSRKEDFLLHAFAHMQSLIRAYSIPAAVSKCNSKAASFRFQGNQLYADKRYSDAILMYNLVRGQ